MQRIRKLSHTVHGNRYNRWTFCDSGDLRVGMVTGAVSIVTVSYLVITACAISSGGTLASWSSAMTQDNLIIISFFSKHITEEMQMQLR